MRLSADAIKMHRSAWVAVLLVVLAGWGIAALMAVTLVLLVGWLGILIIGLAICFCAAQAELDDKAPVASVALLRRQYAQTFEGTAEARPAKWAERVEHNKWLYIAKTVGISAILIGLN